MDDLAGAIKEIVRKYSGLQQSEDELCGWTSFDMKDGSTRGIRMITPVDYPRFKGIRFRWIRGEDPVTVKLVQINAGFLCQDRIYKEKSALILKTKAPDAFFTHIRESFKNTDLESKSPRSCTRIQSAQMAVGYGLQENTT